MLTGETIVTLVSAVVAVLLQVFLAPHITIGFAFPNFIAALCLVLALVRKGASSPVLPFVLGLVFDLVSGGPVGAMAFTLTGISTFASWMYGHVNNDTVFMAILVLALSIFLVELIYGIIFLLFGYAAGFLDAFVYRMLPSFVFDFILALVLYAVMARFFGGDPVTRTEIKQL